MALNLRIILLMNTAFVVPALQETTISVKPKRSDCDMIGCLSFCSEHGMIGRCKEDNLGEYCKCDFLKSPESIKTKPDCDNETCLRFCLILGLAGTCEEDKRGEYCKCSNTPVIPLRNIIPSTIPPVNCITTECSSECASRLVDAVCKGTKEGWKCVCQSSDDFVVDTDIVYYIYYPKDVCCIRRECHSFCDLGNEYGACGKYFYPKKDERGWIDVCVCKSLRPWARWADASSPELSTPEAIPYCNVSECVTQCAKINLKGYCDRFGCNCRRPQKMQRPVQKESAPEKCFNGECSRYCAPILYNGICTNTTVGWKCACDPTSPDGH